MFALPKRRSSWLPSAASPIARYRSMRMTICRRTFHIEGRGFRALVEIETMVVRVGNHRRAREALTWAEANIELLRSE